MMMTSDKFRLVLGTLCVAAVGTLAACASNHQGANGRANPNDVAQVTVNDPINDPNSPLARNRSVYFDFDRYEVKNEYQPMLRMHAAYLKTHPYRHVLIQGNTDERGTSEYNLALGEKRAQAVRRNLATMGVADTQMEAVSLGKEKPVAQGHNEAAWAQNRRADLVYPQQ